MTNAKQDLKFVYRKLKLEEYIQEKLDRLDRPLKSYSHFMLDSQPNYCYPLRPSAPLPAHGLKKGRQFWSDNYEEIGESRGLFEPNNGNLTVPLFQKY